MGGQEKGLQVATSSASLRTFLRSKLLISIDISHCDAKIKSLTDVTTGALNKIRLRLRFNRFDTVLKCIFLANCTMASRMPVSFLSSEIPSMKMRSIFAMTNIGE